MTAVVIPEPGGSMGCTKSDWESRACAHRRAVLNDMEKNEALLNRRLYEIPEFKVKHDIQEFIYI